jgi:RNA polymerase sigma-70 factor, ECF subfamily
MISWLAKKVHVLGKLSEYHLLQKTKKGDKEAFGELYLHYLDSIYRYIFFRVNQNREVSEDLTQTVFFKAWQGIHTFTSERGNFRAWLYRIAHNSVIDYYKIAKAASPVTEEIMDSKTLEDLEDQFDNEIRVATILQAMKMLTDEQQTVITMKFIDGFSHTEIADILDKQEDAVRAMQYRALQRLRKLLHNHE